MSIQRTRLGSCLFAYVLDLENMCGKEMPKKTSSAAAAEGPRKIYLWDLSNIEVTYVYDCDSINVDKGSPKDDVFLIHLKETISDAIWSQHEAILGQLGPNLDQLEANLTPTWANLMPT